MLPPECNSRMLSMECKTAWQGKVLSNCSAVTQHLAGRMGLVSSTDALFCVTCRVCGRGGTGTEAQPPHPPPIGGKRILTASCTGLPQGHSGEHKGTSVICSSKGKPTGAFVRVVQQLISSWVCPDHFRIAHKTFP